MSIPRRLLIPHGIAFDKWGPDTPDSRGIGGSETAHIEIARRMAERGWEVICYAPLPDGPVEDRGVRWFHMESMDPTIEGYWFIFRQPELLDRFNVAHPGQLLTVIAQDEAFGQRWNDERAHKVDLLFGLCGAHCQQLESEHPLLKGKVRQISNGIKLEGLRELDKDMPERNPHRLMWATSPDRGLFRLLTIFPRVREWVHDAELHVFYGFDNIDKLVAMGQQFGHFQIAKDQIEALMNQPGVVWHGRVPQPELWREWAKSAVFAYPTTFKETSNISLMESQCCGAIPVVTPIWAQAENTMAGSFIAGDPTDDLVQARFVGEIYRWLSSPELQEAVRPNLMKLARMRFWWERQVDDLEAHLLGFAGHADHRYQFAFQLKHAEGNILNVGCAGDPAELKKLGAVNVDIMTEDPIFHKPTKADILADCRSFPSWLHGELYTTVIYGDILEHFQVTEVPDILRRAKQCLAPGGKIIITVPNDHRPADAQHVGSDGTETYAAGVCACHDHPVPRETVEWWLKEAGLKPEVFHAIHGDHYEAWGVVARPISDKNTEPRITRYGSDGTVYDTQKVPPKFVADTQKSLLNDLMFVVVSSPDGNFVVPPDGRLEIGIEP